MRSAPWSEERDRLILDDLLDDLPLDHPLVLEAERSELVEEALLDGYTREEAEEAAAERIQAERETEELLRGGCAVCRLHVTAAEWLCAARPGWGEAERAEYHRAIASGVPAQRAVARVDRWAAEGLTAPPESPRRAYYLALRGAWEDIRDGRGVSHLRYVQVDEARAELSAADELRVYRFARKRHAPRSLPMESWIFWSIRLAPAHVRERYEGKA